MRLSLKATTRNRESYNKYTLVNLNLRKGKSAKDEVIEVIPQGSKLEVIDAEQEWVRVRYMDQEGYVYKKYLSTSKYPWTNLNLREAPHVEDEILISIPQKKRVQVLETDGDWSKVIYNDQEGYVFNYFLSDDGNNPHVINYKYFYTDMTRFVNGNNIKSPTNYLLVTDLKNRYTYLFEKDSNKWVERNKWPCTVGKAATPTIEGLFYINGRKPYFGTDEYSVKYATRIKDGYYYHSTLYDSEGEAPIDERLGMSLSHGCIRLEVSDAKWIYENVPDLTAVFIH